MPRTERVFPVMIPKSQAGHFYRQIGCPTGIAWRVVAPHEDRALANHRQSLDELADRGGLSPKELAALLTGAENVVDYVHETSRQEAVWAILAACEPADVPSPTPGRCSTLFGNGQCFFSEGHEGQCNPGERTHVGREAERERRRS